MIEYHTDHWTGNIDSTKILQCSVGWIILESEHLQLKKKLTWDIASPIRKASDISGGPQRHSLVMNDCDLWAFWRWKRSPTVSTLGSVEAENSWELRPKPCCRAPPQYLFETKNAANWNFRIGAGLYWKSSLAFFLDRILYLDLSKSF